MTGSYTQDIMMIKEASNPKIAQLKQYRGFDYQNQTMNI